MSEASKVHRRSLFDAFRRALGSPAPHEKARPGFSLSEFYDRREEAASDAPAFPHFTLRAGIATAETTSTGRGETANMSPKAPRGGAA